MMYGWLYAHVVHPLYHYAIGSGVNAAICELDEHDKLSSKELITLQRQKLAALLVHARANVPYYREVMNDADPRIDNADNIDAFETLPLLTKEVIRSEGMRLTSENLEGNRLDRNSTSGSSGTPMRFFTDRRSTGYRKATVIRNRKWLGIKTGDPNVHLWGSPIDQKQTESLRGQIHGLITRERFLSAYQMGDINLLKYARFMHRFGPRLLVGYPSVLAEFARYCKANDIRFPTLRAIICSAEALYQHHRDIIENTFLVPVYNRYGCREVGDIAHEIPGNHGLVVNADRILVEIVDGKGRCCGPGKLGDILVTDLDNYGMPFIRYRTGDIGSWSAAEEKHGKLPYPVLDTVEGRSMDIVVTPSGARIGGTFWTILLRKRPGIAAFQVVQDTRDGITVNFVKEENAKAIDFDYFREKIAEKCGWEFSVSFEPVEKVTPEPNGKFRLVVSRIGPVSEQRCNSAPP